MTDRIDPRAPVAAARATRHGLAALRGVLLVLFALAPLTAIAEEVGDDPIAARVEGREIHRSDVLESAQDLPPAYLEQMETIYPFLRDRLVDFELVAIEGREAGLAEDAEVIEMVRAFEDEAIRHIYLRRLLEEAITDEMLQERYDAFVAAQPPVEEVRARHILVETEEAAREIIGELNNGGDFAALAQERSVDRASADQHGGDLGYFVHAEMVAPFADAAFALDTGSYTTEPVETEYGWHVILVEDHRVRAAPPLEEMREELEGQIAEEVIRERLEVIRADAEIELFDYEGAPDERADAESAESAEPVVEESDPAADEAEPADATDPALQ
jgi:peptidyl-prolyl cis-trans isomerase C